MVRLKSSDLVRSLDMKSFEKEVALCRLFFFMVRAFERPA
ncbi:hypothetical protein AmDm5_0078 [Acetobacter malorum]|nr:hypothetical protein AmDm5_0078 [Acetobacter malorum]